MTASPLPAEIDDALALDQLKRHGIGGDTASLAAFLSDGFPQTTVYSSLPERPAEKCQVLIYAMQILGKRGAKDALAPLSLLARGVLGPGIQQMVQRDTLQAPPNSRSGRRQQIVEFLRYNAAVALGLIGDPHSAPILREMYEAESNPTVKCQYALSLACLGDPAGIPFMVAEIQKGNQTSSVAAAISLFYVAGVEFGYKASSPIRLRRKLAEDYTLWWNQTRGRFQLAPRSIISRRLDPYPRPRLPLDTVPNLVALASDRLDFSNARGSRTAAARLDAMGSDLAKQLEPILYDPMEDLLARCEAMRRYVLLRGKDARKTMDKLSDDENPEIAEYAAHALKAIEDGSALRPPVFTTEVVQDTPPAESK